MFKKGDAVEFRRAASGSEEWRSGVFEGETQRCIHIRDQAGDMQEYWKHKIDMRKPLKKGENKMLYPGLSKCNALEVVHLFKALSNHMVSGEFGVTAQGNALMTAGPVYVGVEHTKHEDGSEYVDIKLGAVKIHLVAERCQFAKKIRTDLTVITIYDESTNLTYWFEYVDVPLEALNEAKSYSALRMENQL